MPVRVVGDGPVETLRIPCCCMRMLEFTFEDVTLHRTDSDHDAVEKKGLYVACPRRGCGERTWIGADRGSVRYARVSAGGP